MRRIDELFMNDPTIGSRTIRNLLRRDGYQSTNRKRVQRLMRLTAGHLSQTQNYATSSPAQGLSVQTA